MPRIYDDGLTRGVKMRDYLVAIYKSKGKDLTHCELCGKKIKIPYFHHTKYEGAGLTDMKVVCAKCNLLPENKNLK